MSRQPQEALVEPKILEWARAAMRLTTQVVAKKLRVSEATVRKWESGGKPPTLKTVEKLAHLYKRPLAVFFLPAPPQEEPLPQDFRTLPADTEAGFSPQTLLAIRRARRLQELAHELLSGLARHAAPHLGGADLHTNPEALASAVRGHIRIPMETQYAWKDELHALDEWKEALEATGLLVCQFSFPIEEARGFSLNGGHLPVIVLNSQDATNGRIFSLFHEYAHLLLSLNGICDMEERSSAARDIGQVEQFCNRFAGALLVPGTELRAKVPVARPRWDDESLGGLAGLFRVSQEVILRRLVILGLATLEHYQQTRERWQREREDRRQQRKFGRVNIAKKCVRENGRPFVSMVLDARREGKITRRDVADYLGVRLKHMGTIERIISRPAHP